MPLEMNEREKFIEDVGHMFDDWGLGQTPGRIVGLLMIANPPYKSLTEISNELNLAKSTVSTALNKSTLIPFLDKTSRKGGRRDYYSLDHNFLMKGMTTKNRAITIFNDIIRGALDIIGEEETAQRDTLKEMSAFYSWYEKRLPFIVEEWEEEWRRIQASKNR